VIAIQKSKLRQLKKPRDWLASLGSTKMTKNEVVQILCVHFESLFPKLCPNCNRCFATLHDYIQNTTRLGVPMSYDAEFDNWNTRQPIGSMAFANCSCGSTLALGPETMVLSRRLELLNWVRIETQRRKIIPSELLEGLRDEIRKQILGWSIQKNIWLSTGQQSHSRTLNPKIWFHIFHSFQDPFAS